DPGDGLYTDGDLVIDGYEPEVLTLDNISKDELQFRRDGSNLSIAVRGRGTITVSEYFSHLSKGVVALETIERSVSLAKDRIVELDADCRGWFSCDSFESAEGNGCLAYGGDIKEKIVGSSLNDVVFGAGGNDRLYGGDGNDTLLGGAGIDTLHGDAGSDTLYGDAGKDVLFGGTGDDALIGGNDNDRLEGGMGNDWLWGDDGSDSLYGDHGADILIGSHGNDSLYGGDGGDLYLFNRGDGQDKLHDKNIATLDGDGDIVRFGTAISSDDVAIYMSGANLYINYGENDVVTVTNQVSAKDKIERIELEDGSYMTDADINQLIQEISSFAVSEGICINSVNDVRNNEELMTLVADSWQAA
ncbi:MAG: hypothetical protein KAU22_05955, partial [Desulfuromonadales bacterium]|nr:hypothetical protein [Desulfuromonadales bacterium]